MRHTRQLSSEEFWTQISESDAQVRQEATPNLLYGIADWLGPVMLGTWESRQGLLTLAELRHTIGSVSNVDAHGIDVAVTTHSSAELVHEWRLSKISPARDEQTLKQSDHQAASPPTGTVSIPVNGHTTTFDLWTTDRTHYAACRLDIHSILIEARHIDLKLDTIALVSVHDIEPYIAGRRAWLRAARNEIPDS